MLPFLIGRESGGGLSDVAFAHTPPGNEGSKSWECQEESMSGRENSPCKGPEAGVDLYVWHCGRPESRDGGGEVGR